MTTLAEYLRPFLTDLTQDVGDTPVPGLRDYLGADAAEDPKLKAWWSEAIEWCNEVLSRRDFVDDDGVDINPPDPCVLATYEHVRVIRDYARLESVLSRKTKTGAREEEREVPGTAGRLSQAQIAAWPRLEKYCQDVSLFASGGA